MAGKGVNNNLIPGDQRSHENNRENGRLGGYASAESKKRRKATRELIELVLSSPVEVSTKKGRAALKRVGYDVGEQGPPSVELLMQLQIATQAMAGDLASATWLYSYAQVPDLKAQLERERVRAMKRGAAEATADALQQARDILGGIDSAIR